MQLKKIKVYGKLRQFLGKSYFIAAVKSPQQAMSFLIANFEGVQKHMNDQLYKIKMGGMVVTEEYLSMSGQGDIQIIPVAVGSAFVVPLLLGGGALSASSALAATFTAGLSGFFLGSLLSTGLSIVGYNLIADGVSQLLSSNNSSSNNSNVSDIDPAIRGSYSFSGIQNISSSGVPIPIIYGYVYSGSILISSGVDNAQLVAIINASPNDSVTYSQSGNRLTVYLNNHGFVNGDSVRLDFISGPLADHPTLDQGGFFGVENATTNAFESSLGMWSNQSYANSDSNVVKVLQRNTF
tara:strand:+ start:1813 stop:2697 length:885 start_codon:yes stop_codon:yes gene_type:complete